MAVFNAAKREIDLKIVYYGPAMCGKTTNVQCIHKMLAPQQRGELMSLATKDDRTLFFDFLPIELGDVRGFKTRFHIYTVPGQVYYALTRRAVLTGADGVVFVVDSQSNKLQENIESLKDLSENLRFYKKDLTAFPFVLQYNKRDLPNVMPTSELNSILNTLNVPALESSAVTGMGVVETLTTICKIVLKQMDSGTAKKKPLQSSARQAPRQAAEPETPEMRIFANQPTGPISRQAEPEATPTRPQAAPLRPAPPPNPASVPPPNISAAAEPPVRSPLGMKATGQALPDFTDMNPLQSKKTPEFSFKQDGPPASGLSFAQDSPTKAKPPEEDFSDLMIDTGSTSEEPELSFEDDAAVGLEFEDEPAPGPAEPELTFEDSATGLEFDEYPAPAEPELSFEDDGSDLIIDETAPEMSLAEPVEEDGSGLILDQDDIAEPAPQAADPDTFTLEEPAEFKFDEPPSSEGPAELEELSFDEDPVAEEALVLDEPPAPDMPLLLGKPSVFDKTIPGFDDDVPALQEQGNADKAKTSPADAGSAVITACGQAQIVSDTAVKLPITLRLRNDAECRVSIVISIEREIPS